MPRQLWLQVCFWGCGSAFLIIDFLHTINMRPPAGLFTFCIGVDKRGDDDDPAIGVLFTLSSVPVAHGAWVVEDGTNSKEDPSTPSPSGPYGCGLRCPLLGVEGSDLSLIEASCG